jgi:hypothetical protein
VGFVALDAIGLLDKRLDLFEQKLCVIAAGGNKAYGLVSLLFMRD